MLSNARLERGIVRRPDDAERRRALTRASARALPESSCRSTFSDQTRPRGAMPGNPVNCRRRDVAQCRADPCCAKAEAIQDWLRDGAARRIGDLIEGAARPQIAKRAPENGDDLSWRHRKHGKAADH